MHMYLVSVQHRLTRWRKAEAESGDSAGEQGRHPRDGGLYLPGEDFHDATMTRIVPLAKLLRAQASASSALGTSPVRVSDAYRHLPICRCSRKGDQVRAQSACSSLQDIGPWCAGRNVDQGRSRDVLRTPTVKGVIFK